MKDYQQLTTIIDDNIQIDYYTKKIDKIVVEIKIITNNGINYKHNLTVTLIDYSNDCDCKVKVLKEKENYRFYNDALKIGTELVNNYFGKNKIKIVINSCYGGARLSKLALEKILNNPDFVKRSKIFNLEYLNFYEYRSDPVIINVVEELKELASGECSSLEVVEVTEDWMISDYDGKESVYYN